MMHRASNRINMAGKEDEISNILDATEEDDEEGEEVTAAEVLERLEQAWLNEKFAPELLECKVELVECMVDQIKEMEGNLKDVGKGDLVGSFHKLEIQRIRYVISSYLKIRLKKIEKYVFNILEPTKENAVDYVSRLSPEEYDYATQYRNNVQDLLKSLALDSMPSNIRTLDKKSVPQPDLNSYLFMKVLQPQDQVELDPDEQPVDLEEGAQHLVRYNVISSLLENGSVALI